MLNELKPLGAEGTALTWKVKLSASVCAVISGVPFAVKFYV